MLQASATANDTNKDQRPSRVSLFGKLTPAMFYIFLAITGVAVFIPLKPALPAKGIDASWEYAMNEAVARHMSIGTDVVFTYGPYATVGDRSYNPATDHRMMLGSLFVGASYMAAMIFLADGKRRYLIVLLMLFLATFGNPETLLLSYSFLLTICAFKCCGPLQKGNASPMGRKFWLVTAVCWSTLGLLPLIKGSLLLPFIATVALPCSLLFFRRRFRQGLLLTLIPLAAVAALWVSAGQRFAGLPAFLRTTLWLTSGYTEAMSTSWTIMPSIIGDLCVVIFLALSVILCISAIRSAGLTAGVRWMLVLLWAVYLLVIFKHGFVKAEGVRSAFVSLTAFALIAAFFYVDRWMIWAASIALVLTIGTSVMGDGVLNKQVHDRFGSGVTWGGTSRKDILAFCIDRAAGAYARTTYMNTWRTYSDAWEGLAARIGFGASLEDKYTKAIAKIQDAYPVPRLNGSADIYNYEESALLASGNQWSPRPVIQSYSAYTPELAALNEQHLRGKDAPDWALFDLQTIDGRLPSLDDGMSWPALLDNYNFVPQNAQFVLMQKKQTTRANSTYSSVTRETCKTGEPVALPQADGPWFAEVELKPTLAGQLLTTLFNPPHLRIVLGFEDGSKKSYRVVSNMMSTGFIVSPFVGDTQDFASLVSHPNGWNDEKKVANISISPTYGGSAFWSDTYVLTLKRYVAQ